MSSLAARLDEMIVLYTLDRMTIRAIADRYGATAVTVKTMLLGAGVELMAQPRKVGGSATAPVVVCDAPATLRPPPVRRPEPVQHYDAGDLIPEDDRRHVRSVIQTLGGRGFPYLQLPGRASA
jgi:hypothetical protein